MKDYMDYWMSSVDISNLKQKIGERQVYVWGAFSTGMKVYHFLLNHDIQAAGFIDGHKDTSHYIDKPVCKPEQLLSSARVFIIVAIAGLRDEIVHYLKKYDYQDAEDFLYPSIECPEIELTSIRKKYKDINDNEIVYNGTTLKCSITLIGHGNKITIDEGFAGSDATKIIAENGATIHIGKYFRTEGKVVFEVLDGGRLSIGNSCFMMKDSRINARKGSVTIGDYVTIGERFLGNCSENSPLSIGNDCMLSHDITLLSTNAHSIFDLTLEENIVRKNEKYVKVGNHVWLGKGVTVLYNSIIGNGSIVGASSVVKGENKENCILAGNLAKVIREDCTWDRRRDIEYWER